MRKTLLVTASLLLLSATPFAAEALPMLGGSA
jgi:hypothetical protein